MVEYVLTSDSFQSIIGHNFDRPYFSVCISGEQYMHSRICRLILEKRDVSLTCIGKRSIM